MTMWRKAIPFLLVLSVAVNIPFVVMWASHVMSWSARDGDDGRRFPRPGRPGPDGPPSGPDGLMRKIGVSDEQWETMKDRQVAFHEALKRSFRQTEALDQELLDMIAAPEPNRDALRAKQDEILEAHRKRQELIVEQLLADKRDLTAEQQAKLFEILRRMRGPGMGPPHHPPPPGDFGPTRDFPAKKHGPPDPAPDDRDE